SFGSVSTRTSSSRTGTNSGDLFQDGGVWAQYLHSKGKQDHRDESDGFDSRLNGITFGADGDINDHWTLGVALTAADVTTSSSTTGSSSITDTTSYIGTLYGSWQNSDRFVDIMASAGLSKNETEQVEIFGLTTSEYDAKQLGFRLVTGQDFWLDSQAMVLQPNLSFNYGRIDIEAYQEVVQSLSLPSSLEKQRYEVVELGAGITAMKSFELDRGILDVSLSLNVYHDFAADQVQVKSSFITSNGNETAPTTHIGEEPEKTTWQAGLGLNYQISNTLSASVNYDHTWKSTFAADSASIKLRYDF
nr:autotransporter outer membrane beta-barrel domain-containing protein [Endozoicomonas sp.]